MFVDHMYIMRAAIPADDYDSYISRLGLHEDPNSDYVVDFEVNDAPAWWNPPEPSGNSSLRFAIEEDQIAATVYQKPSVYYLWSTR